MSEDQKSQETRNYCYIIAEAGVNHNGDITLAKSLIDAAKQAGADAVKFQTFKAEEVVSSQARKAPYQCETTGTAESQLEMIRALELTDDQFRELYSYAQKQNITFLSTPFDHQSADFLDSLNLPAFKIPSGEITNIPLLKHIGQKKKPVILSTGMSTLGEVEEAITALQLSGTHDITLLHCTTAYPAPIESVNLEAMNTLACAFHLPVGYSDHTEGITIPIAAAALGARVIEKHFTLDCTLPGPDHRASLEPHELVAMVRAIRDVEIARGDGIKKSSNYEKENQSAARRSLIAHNDISKGTVIERNMLSILRPGNGISPKYIDNIIGKVSLKEIKKGTQIEWNDLSN